MLFVKKELLGMYNLNMEKDKIVEKTIPEIINITLLV